MNQDERDEILITLNQAVKGNGVKGLCDRQDDTEEWQKEHEERHRKQVEDNQRYRKKREAKEFEEAESKRKHRWAIVGAVGLVLLAEFIPHLFRGIKDIFG